MPCTSHLKAKKAQAHRYVYITGHNAEIFIYLKSMSYTKYTYKKENVQKQAPLKNIYKHINLKKN